MPINSFLYPATQVASSFEVANSLRFNSASSDDLVRTSDSQSTTKFTWSAWFKRVKSGGFEVLWNERQDSSNFTQAYFEEDAGDPTDALSFQSYKSGSYHYNFKTNRLFRDFSAWYNVILILDTTLATQSDRLKIFVNGVRETSFHTSTNNISQNDTLSVNGGASNDLKLGSNGSSGYFNGYMCEVVYVPNDALSHTDLGEFDEDSNIWKPKNVSGLTFSTAGYYLDFKDSSALGNDVSGNNNDFTTNNLTAIDQTTDTCTNNFSTLNPLEPSPNAVVYSEGALVVTGSGGNGGRFAGGTISLNSGKWWCEIKVTTNGSYPILGIIDSRSSFKRDAIYMTEGSQTAQNRSAYAVFSNSDIYNNGDNNFGDFGTTYTTGDIIGVGLNLDASPPTLTFKKNGSNEVTVNVEVPPSGFYTFPAIGMYYASAKAEVNFGNSPFSISSGVADANGFGLFEYAPKTGYYSCCTKNLVEYG